MSAKKKKTKDNLEENQISEETLEPTPEVVSGKKVIYAEIDDEVTVVFDKVKAVKGNHVYIVVPKRSILFQSIVNLKILKRKAEDQDKKIYLVTNDKNGIHLAQKVGIEVYNKANTEGKPALFSTEVEDERLRITPLRATVNAVEDETPTRLSERKLSISEILRKRKSNKNNVEISQIQNTPKKKEKKARPKFVIVAPNRHALIGLVAVSLVILLFIVYIALPGATVYLTPAASVLEKSVNITLADYQKNRAYLETRPTHTIAAYPINTTVSRTITHTSTGKKFSDRGANASGKITIINTSANTWPLVAQTRFQNADGIVFRINSQANVPAASVEGPGKVEAFVVADQVDAYGSIVGERGNIPPSRFFLPGLKESSRSQVYAESSEPMTGGVTDYLSFISKEDVEASKSRLNDELLKSAVADLKLAVADKSKLVGTDGTYNLLEGEQAVKVGEVKINIDPGLEGRELREFEVSGTVEVSGVYYDHDAMLAILRNELLLKKSPQKELLRVNEDSTTYRIFEWDEAAGRIKLTANIKGVEQFSIDPEKESGANLIQKIKERIVGMDIEQAELYIQNLPEINKVQIESWPAWSPTVPNISDNIKFEIRSTIEAK